MLYLWILVSLLALETVLGHGHFAFPQNSPREIQSNYEIEEPTGKHFHKVKKLRKKQQLLCLLGGGGRNVPEDSPEAKFLFPVIQQTDVNVGYPGGSNHLASSGYGGGSNCESLLSSGGSPGGGLLSSHPLLASLGSSLGSTLGGLGGNKPSVDEDQNRYYNFNMKRHVMRPIYKSMKAFYRLFR